jgi:hypothetical protein
MTEPVTTYTVKGKNFDNIWLFKYNLNGFLKAFILEEGTLTKTQQTWLFNAEHFPYTESQMQRFGKFKNIEVTKGEPDLSFESFYKAYNYAVGKKNAQNAYKKLSKADKIKAIASIKAYEGFLFRKKIPKAYPATYLNQRRFDDEFNRVF